MVIISPNVLRVQQGPATQLAATLRKAGLSVDLVLEIRKPKANFKHAARVAATHVAMVAPSEWGEGKVRFITRSFPAPYFIPILDERQEILVRYTAAAAVRRDTAETSLPIG